MIKKRGTFVLQGLKFGMLGIVGLLILLGGTPLALAVPTTDADCQALYREYDAQMRQLRNQARHKGDQAWQIARTRGNNAASPYYQAAHRLSEEHRTLLRQATQERQRCYQEVSNLKRRQAAEKRNQSRTLGTQLIQQGRGELVGEFTNAGKSRLRKNMLPKKWNETYGKYRKGNRRLGLAQEISALWSGKQSWQEKYNSIFKISNTFALEAANARSLVSSQYSLAHSLSDEITLMALARLKVVHLNSLNQFKDAMTEFDNQHRAFQVQEAVRMAAAEANRIERTRSARIERERQEQEGRKWQAERDQGELLAQERADAEQERQSLQNMMEMNRIFQQGMENIRNSSRRAQQRQGYTGGSLGSIGDYEADLNEFEVNRAPKPSKRQRRPRVYQENKRAQ